MFEEQINNLENKIDNVFVYGVSGMDEQVLISGRPFGGCAIIWDRAMTCEVNPIRTQSRRLCAVEVLNEGFEAILIYVFLFEIYLFRVTRSSVINSCFSTRPWLNNTTTIHAWTTCGNSQCYYMMLQINFESIQ